MTEYYIGQRDNWGQPGPWEVFAADRPEDATPEATGYLKVQGPFDSKEEAEEVADAENR